MHPLGHAFRSCFRLLLCLMFAAAALGFAAQQPAAPAVFDSKEFLARSITRLALVDLRAASAPQEADYRLAHLLLGIAVDTCPTDAEILRRKIEAGYACGDDKAVLENTRALVRLDPSDTVSQLRLITSLISEKAQNADDRLQVYDQFIADKRIDAAIRSRLALDAALLLRERGDNEGFRKRLSISCQLDSSHKEAAALAAAVIAEQRPDDAMGRFLALQNLLMADPLDPNVHLALCRELVNARAFKAARRFHKNADVIAQVAQVTSERGALESIVLEMHANGPAAAAESINRQLQLARDSVARDLRAVQEAGHPTDSLRKPEDVRLSANTHVLYILALAAAGDTAGATSSLSDFAEFIRRDAARANEEVVRGKMTREDALKMLADLSAQLQMTRLMSDLQVDLVRKDLTASQSFVEQYPGLFRQLGPWLLARENEPDKAIAEFEADADENSNSQLGIAVSHEVAQRTEQAIQAYNKVLSMAPLEPPGAWARCRLLALGSKEDQSMIAAMEAAAAKIPAWIDAMAVEPQRFEQLNVDVASRDPGAIDRAVLHVRLQNLAQIPLALGSDRPLSSRLLLAPKLEAVSGGTISLARPEVANIDRRIRLMPNESLDVELWPDSGQCGLLMESLANRSVRVRWRVIQGFQSDPRGGFAPGVMGISTESAASVRRPLSEATLEPAGLAKQVSEGPINLIGRLAAVARAQLIQPLIMPKVSETSPPKAGELASLPAAQPVAAAPGDQMTPVADAFAGRYPKLGLAERCMLITTLPHARLTPVMQPVDQAMRAETDPLALILVLTTRIVDPQDELLAKCKESDDPRLREAAGLVQQRLANSDMIYARWTAEDIGKRPPPQVEVPGVPQ